MMRILFATWLVALLVNHAAAETAIVVPNEYENVEAPDGVSAGTGNAGFRFQGVMAASEFMSLPFSQHTLTGYRSRPDGILGIANSASWLDFTLKVSTTDVTPSTLATSFQANIGDDERTVYNGPITFNTSNVGPVGGPKEFDIIIDFQTPFHYDPSAGNLLLDWTVKGPWSWVGDDRVASNPNTNYVVSGDPNAAFGILTPGTGIFQLIFVPEPTTLVLAVFGLLGLAVCGRRNNNSQREPLKFVAFTLAVFSSAIVSMITAPANATILYSEDFSSGNAARAVWSENPSSRNFDASSGDYVLRQPNGETPVYAFLNGVPEIRSLTDTSVRAQVRFGDSSVGSAALFARLKDNRVYQGGYFDEDGQRGLYLGWNEGTTFHLFDAVAYEYDLKAEDLVLQLDVIGNELTIWAWRPGEGKPAVPQLTYTDNEAIATSGRQGILHDPDAAGTASTTTFRYLQVADSPIPEPSTLFLSLLGLAAVCIGWRRKSKV